MTSQASRVSGVQQPKSYWRQSWRDVRRNPVAMVSLAFLVAIVIAAGLGPLIAPYPPDAISPRVALAAPGGEHILGTDALGRDTLSRLIFGARVSLLVGFSAMALSIAIGVVVGAVSGYYGVWVGGVLMRITDAMMSLPRLFLLLLILTFFGGSLNTVIVVIGVTSWMGPARLVRGEFLRWKEAVFVEAAHALGAEGGRIIGRHILPQLSSSVIVAATFGVAQAILIESAMSFLGLGVQPPTPTWGNMLTNAQNYIWSAPLQAFFPGVMILLTVLAFNFLGDGLRDALDPKRSA